MFRVLSADKLQETADRVRQQIEERFPGSGLAQVAAEVGVVVGEAVVRAEGIRQPNWWYRGGLGVLLLIAIVGVVCYVVMEPEALTWSRLVQFFDAAKGIAAYLIAAAIFLVTLEVRLERRRAVKAVHELRAMAHIIDMHQLTKDPDRFGLTVGPVMVSGKVMTVEAMGRYLHYCTELLAILGKIGQLYVQDFPDGTALAAVDQCEDLTTGLSSKIWQKIMILDQIRADSGEAGSKETKAAEELREPAKR